MIRLLILLPASVLIASCSNGGGAHNPFHMRPRPASATIDGSWQQDQIKCGENQITMFETYFDVSDTVGELLTIVGFAGSSCEVRTEVGVSYKSPTTVILDYKQPSCAPGCEMVCSDPEFSSARGPVVYEFVVTSNDLKLTSSDGSALGCPTGSVFQIHHLRGTMP